MRKLIALVFVIGLFMSAGAWGADSQKAWDAFRKKDYATAFTEFLPLAELGDAGAQYALGFMYANGNGVIYNYQEAFKWYKLSAEQGNPSAQDGLAFLYAFGNGVPQDYIRAQMWHNVSATSGRETSINNRDAFVTILNPAQIKRAQELARECIARDYKGC